jgi:hypothetical protein
VQDLIIKLQSIEGDFADLNAWIGTKSTQLSVLIKKTRPMVIKSKMNLGEKFSTIKEEEEDEGEMDNGVVSVIISVFLF